MKDSIFQEFIQKAPEIKEKWEVVRLFEEERQKFQEELQVYENEIAQARAVLKDLRAELLEAKNHLKDLETRQQSKKEEIKAIQQELFTHKVQRDLVAKQKNREEILDQEDKELLPQPVSFVEIYLKDRSVARARPAKRFFSDQLYRKYRVLLRENRALKDRIFELDLENSTLKIELRDIKTKDFLKANGYLEEPSSKDES
ncbi:nickel-binding protein Mua [Helicobacter baculiformis]|uniref:Nickel-binding protein Mua n=1 Tax=Helicobacter baculiformis TaxID=427351 RepID=A0ABV7ZJ08_9HELI|nr:nickel-binding protein Mua [Helicobacter baculiformis]